VRELTGREFSSFPGLVPINLVNVGNATGIRMASIPDQFNLRKQLKNH